MVIQIKTLKPLGNLCGTQKKLLLPGGSLSKRPLGFSQLRNTHPLQNYYHLQFSAGKVSANAKSLRNSPVLQNNFSRIRKGILHA